MDKLTPAVAAAKITHAPGPPPRAHLGGVGGVVSEKHPGFRLTPSGVSPRIMSASPGLGVYVHFPWCIKKCPYCDFLSVPSARQDIPHAAYADAVLSELSARRAELGAHHLRTVFFGGGTPSLWQAAELRRVLGGILATFEPGPEPPEVTVECNPGSLSYDAARALLDAGVNRLSIGVQGLDEGRLRFLGRWHSAGQALAAVQAALDAGVPRVSADLIYGVSEQRPEEAAAEVRQLSELGVSHLSAYALTIEPQTAFGALARKGRLPLAPEQSVAESFLAVDEALEQLGFEHYEISNFARSGQRAEHNVGYWKGLDYVGLGCGAWGTLTRAGQRIRYRNRPQPQGYMEAARAARAPSPDSIRSLESESEALEPETLLSERLMLGLRLAEGLDAEQAAVAAGATLWTSERRRVVQRLVERGRLLHEGPRLRIPKAAWLFSDGTISELL